MSRDAVPLLRSCKLEASGHEEFERVYEAHIDPTPNIERYVSPHLGRCDRGSQSQPEPRRFPTFQSLDEADHVFNLWRDLDLVSKKGLLDPENAEDGGGGGGGGRKTVNKSVNFAGSLS